MSVFGTFHVLILIFVKTNNLFTLKLIKTKALYCLILHNDFAQS